MAGLDSLRIAKKGIDYHTLQGETLKVYA